MSLALGGVAAASTTVTLTPAGHFVDQQTIEVSVGPNTVFQPHSSIKILECQAGATSAAQCDGNTQNADSVIANSDGSFDYRSYTVYQLPSATLGEPAGNTPICDTTHACVLYVGQDQNDFNQPKLFSPSFTFSTGPGNSLPETHFAVLLPLGALAIGAGSWFILRRRSGHSSQAR